MTIRDIKKIHDLIKFKMQVNTNFLQKEESEAIELIKEKLEIDANRDIKIFEESGIKVLNGRFGPYITNGKVNAKIPKDVEPKDLDEDTCLELIKNAPKRKFRRKFRAKKPT